MNNTKSHVAGLVFVSLIISGLGCEKSHEFGQVSGTVRVNGKPMPGLRVNFHPDTDLKQLGPSSEGVTNENGVYTLRCEPPSQRIDEPGAVIGRHKVTIADNDPPATPQGETPPPPKIDPGYRSVSTTTLTAEVKPGSQTIDFTIN